MLRVFLSIVLLLISCNQIFSQQFRIGFETGIGEYAMNDLKGFNDQIISGLPFDAETVDNFPAYYYFEPIFLIQAGRLSAGLLYSYYSTGSRVSAKDYSGEYRLDMKINSNSMGLIAGYDLWTYHDFSLTGGATFRMMSSALAISEYFQIIDSVLIDYSAPFKSLSYSLEPNLTFSRSFGRLILEVNAGYLLGFGVKPFHSGENKEEILSFPYTNVEVKPNWNGFRFGLSLYVNFLDLHGKNP